MKLHFTLFLSAMLLTPCLAYGETITADRPGFSTGTSTVSPHHLNIELGYQRTSSSSTLPQTNLRIGITPEFEFEAQWAGWDFARSGGGTTIGALSLGGKYRLPDQGGIQLSLLALATLPSGNANPGATGISPLAGLLWSTAISETDSTFGMLQLNASHGATWETRAQVALGISHSHDEALSSFAELYADTPLSNGAGNSYLLDGGFSYLLDNRTQLDISLGLSLNNQAADFIGFGFSRSY